MAKEQAINGQVYSWSDIRTNMLGRNLVGFSEINYGDAQDTKGVYGRGRKIIGRVSGPYSANADITLEMGELEALIASLPAGTTIYDIAPFDITVAYVNPENILVTHIIQGCVFTKQDRGAKSGDVKQIDCKLPLFVSDIDWAA